jgi:tRNA A58 N-methylase Trm61
MQSFSKVEEIGNTIRLVEDSIKKFEGYPTELQLFYRLHWKINRTTLKNILAGLERHNRIIRDKDSSIIWIYADTPKAKQSLRESVLLR